jgi:hypothetical protein
MEQLKLLDGDTYGDTTSHKQPRRPPPGQLATTAAKLF